MQHDDNPPSRSPQHIKPIGFGKSGGGKKVVPSEAAPPRAEGSSPAEGAAENPPEGDDEQGPGSKHALSYLPPGF